MKWFFPFSKSGCSSETSENRYAVIWNDTSYWYFQTHKFKAKNYIKKEENIKKQVPVDKDSGTCVCGARETGTEATWVGALCSAVPMWQNKFEKAAFLQIPMKQWLGSCFWTKLIIFI